MRIAIDARELTGKATGVGRYLSEILAAWTALPGALAHDFILCAPQPVEVRGADALRTSMLTSSGHGGSAWEQFALPGLVRSARADVLFAPGYTGPIRRPAPMVLTIHDVSFAAHPEWFSWREGLRRRALTRMSARRAAKVITVSDFSKREIVKHLRIDAAAIEVIYSGATSWDRRVTLDPGPAEAGPHVRPAEAGPHDRAAEGGPRVAPAQAARAAHNVGTDEQVVLYVGSIFNRRHIPALIEGFARVARRLPAARLEIVGDNRTRPHLDVEALIAASGTADRIRARAYVPDEELAALYAGATAFAFLSEYEGFGMTPLEALAAGIPIVVLDTPVAREIYGPAAIYVERPDPAQIGAALEHVLTDQGERARVIAAASVQLERYSWRECAQRTLQILLACT